MSDVDPRAWAGEIAQALTIGGVRIPFQRVLQNHRHGLDALRIRGLTWRSLAQLLLRAGVQRPDGRPYSADHLRVCRLRLESRATTQSAPTSRKPRRRSASATNIAVGKPASDKVLPPDIHRAPGRPMPPASKRETEHKDVSTEELAVVRARLQTFR